MEDVVYKGLQSLGRLIALDLLRWDAEGTKNIPPTGPVILASNHISYLDPPLLFSIVRRPIRFIGKREVFEIPLLGAFLRAMGSFPVKRDRPDPGAVRRALRVLQRGEALGIFPEGTRNKGSHLRPFLEGVGWLAIKARAPVVPIVIDGYLPLREGSDWTRPGRMRVVCGKPLTFASSRFIDASRPHRSSATREVYTSVYSLLPLGDLGERIPSITPADS